MLTPSFARTEATVDETSGSSLGRMRSGPWMIVTAATNDHDRSGQMQQAEGILVGQVAYFLQPIHIRSCRARTGGNQCVAARNFLAIQAQCGRGCKSHFAKFNGDALCIDLLAFGNATDDALYILAHLRHIHVQVGGHQPQHSRVPGLLYYARHVDQALAGHAAIVQTISPQAFFIDEQHVCAERRCYARSRKPAGAAAYDRHVVLCTRHLVLLIIRFSYYALIKTAAIGQAAAMLIIKTTVYIYVCVLLLGHKYL